MVRLKLLDMVKLNLLDIVRLNLLNMVLLNLLDVVRLKCMPSPEFIDVYLRSIFDKTSSDSKKLFIAGDFNFDLLNISTHQDTFEFFDSMMSNFFLPVITLPTKINRGKNSLIIFLLIIFILILNQEI